MNVAKSRSLRDNQSQSSNCKPLCLQGKTARGAQGSQKGDNGGKERGQEAVSEASQERGQNGKEAGQEAGEEAHKRGQEAGDDVEDGVEDRDELGADAEDGDESLDGSEDLGDEGNDQGEDLVEISVAHVQAAGAHELRNDVGKLEVNAPELLGDLLGGVVLAELATLNGGQGLVYRECISTLNFLEQPLKSTKFRRTDGTGVGGDALGKAGDEDDDIADVGHIGTLERSVDDVVGDLANAKVINGNTVDDLEGVANGVDVADLAGLGAEGGGKGRGRKGGDGEESGLHCEW